MDRPAPVHDQNKARSKGKAVSAFQRVYMSRSWFYDASLKNPTFENTNLRGATFSGVDFGGARFECLNTGECRPRLPVTFEGVELDDCRFRDCTFTGVKLLSSQTDGMTIDGILVTELIKFHRRAKRSGRTGR